MLWHLFVAKPPVDSYQEMLAPRHYLLPELYAEYAHDWPVRVLPHRTAHALFDWQ